MQYIQQQQQQQMNSTTIMDTNQRYSNQETIVQINDQV